MKIIFLGTGTSTGIPLIGSSHPVCKSVNKKDKRLRSSILVTMKNNRYEIETESNFKQQMLSYGCERIDRIL